MSRTGQSVPGFLPALYKSIKFSKEVNSTQSKFLGIKCAGRRMSQARPQDAAFRA